MHKKNNALKRIIVAGSTLSVLLTLLFPWYSLAVSGLSQGFTTNETDLIPGTLMGLKADSAQVAERAVANRSYQLLGIVADKPLIELSNGNREVQIATNGLSSALVSSINGDIKLGDKITASPISGIGMKATDSGQIVGTAQASLGSQQTAERTITDKQGNKKTVKVGLIPLQVNVGYYSGSQDSSKLASVLPPVVLAFANTVAGQQVSPLRVIISLFALVFGFMIVASMLQSAVHSGLIALGRNPLAKSALRRELLDICATAIAVLALTILIVYIILKI